MSARKLALIPVWLFVLATMHCRPDGHPLKQQPFTLDGLSDGATEDAIAFGLVLWMSLICAASVIWRLSQ